MNFMHKNCAYEYRSDIIGCISAIFPFFLFKSHSFFCCNDIPLLSSVILVCIFLCILFIVFLMQI